MSSRFTIISELLNDEETKIVGDWMENWADRCVRGDGFVAAYAKGMRMDGDNNPIPLDTFFDDLRPLLQHPTRFAILDSDGNKGAISINVTPERIEVIPGDMNE